MSTDTTASSGSNQDASGDQDKNQTTNDSGSKDSVKYETYQKVLAEKKKRDQDLADAHKRLSALEEEKKQREEASLKEKEDFKKLAELREQELKAEREKRQGLEKNVQEGKKLRAFLDSVQGKVEKQYWALIDLDAIVVNPDTGMPDEESVKKAAKDFEASYPAVIQRKNAGTLPGDAAKGGSAKLTYEEWLKLPVDQKKARLSEVMN